MGLGGWSTGIHYDDKTYRIVPTWNDFRGVAPALTIDRDRNITIGSNLNIANGQYIQFGYNVTDKNGNAGKVGYQLFDSNNALDIAGAGTKEYKRNISLRDNVTIRRALRYPGQICGWYNDDQYSGEGPRYFVMCSLYTMNGAGSNADDFWFILPGYKFVLYHSDGYSTEIKNLDLNNYDGTSVKCVKNTTTQKARSFKVYYRNYRNGDEFTDTEITISGLSNQA